MRHAFVVVALLCTPVELLAAEPWRYGVGAGYAHATSRGEGDSFGLDGGFIVVSVLAVPGVVTSGTISVERHNRTVVADFGGGPQSFHDEAETRRLDLTLGYQFLFDTSFRPSIRAGFAYLWVDETVEGTKVLNDSSVGFTVGAGFEAGTKHNAFILDFSVDFGHGASLDLPPRSVDIDYRHFTAGYLHRF